MNDHLQIEIEVLGVNQLQNYFPDDSFFSFHSIRFGHRVEGKTDQIRSGQQISAMEKKEILESLELSVLRICFVNHSTTSQELVVPGGAFRPELVRPMILDHAGQSIEGRRIFRGKYRLEDPVTYEIQANDQLCFDLVGQIYKDKLIYPSYEYELRRGKRNYFQIRFLGMLSNQVEWLFT